MSLANLREKWDLRFLLKAAAAWAVTAAVLLLAASLLVSKSGMGEGSVGYVSSGVSFLSAVSAGAFAAKGRHGGFVLGLAVGAALSVLLLTVGFIIKGPAIEASGVLSVVTFSFSGALAGCVLLGGRSGARKRRSAPRPRRR